MQINTGLFIVLEGSDGSGKTTQFEALKKRLEAAGHQVEVFDFPRYKEASSYFVTRYLNGQYGPAASVNPYTASLFYALDRYEAAPAIRKALAAGKIVLSNRYVGSNMAHQGTKFVDEIEKRSFFIWEDSIEFQLLNIPRPTINLFLKVPAEISYDLITRKAARDYTSASHDEHEADINHLKKAVETYDLLCNLFPRDFQAINCAPDGHLLPAEAVGQKVWDHLQPLLPTVTAKESRPNSPSQASRANTPVVTQEKIKPEPVEFSWKLPKVSYLAFSELKMRLPAVQAEGLSWSGANTDYDYYIPQSLSADLKDRFKNSLSAIAKQHRMLHADLSKILSSNGSLSRSSAAQQASETLFGAVPVAALTSARLDITKSEASEVINKLSLIQNEEVQELYLDLLSKTKRLWPDIGNDADYGRNEQLPEALGSIIEKLTKDLQPKAAGKREPGIRLVEVHPRNEFELIADGLASYSTISKDDITALMSQWNYEQKTEALKAALQKSPNTIERAIYRVESMQDWQSLLRMLELNVGFNYQRQLAMSSSSYKTPRAIEDAILEDAYGYIPEQARALYETLRLEHDGRTLEYSTLLGSPLSWEMDIKALSLSTAGQKLDDSDTKTLINLIESVHPQVADYLKRSSQPPKKAQDQTRSKPRRRHSKKK